MAGIQTAPPPRPYPLDNDHPTSADHHGALAELLDPVTIARLIGLRGWAGSTCLEVGAGEGSIAGWLAGQGARVTATDIKPDHIPPHPRIRVVAHDLTGDDPLPDGPYDLVHTRLVLGHLPQRESILPRLAALLAPGGVLLVEDWAAMRTGTVIAAPTDEDALLYATYQKTAGTVFDQQGTDPTWARRIHRTMLDCGLVDVATTITAQYWNGSGPGCRIVAATLDQLHPRLAAAGMTAAQLGRLATLLNNPGLIIHGHPLYSTSGHRPA